MEGSGLPNSRYYSGICLERLRKITKTSVWIACLRVEITGPPEYEAGVVTTRPLRAVWPV
jgi:hypothetical protein